MQPTGNTYTPAGGAIQGNLQSIADKYTQAQKNAPQAGANIANAVLAQDTVVGPTSDQRAALVQQLAQHDETYSKQYADPTSSAYMLDPMARERAISAAEAPMYGAIDKSNAMIQSRNSVLGDAVTRGKEIYQAGVDALKSEYEFINNQAAMQQNNDQFKTKTAADLFGQIGGAIPDALATALGLPRGLKIPSPSANSASGLSLARQQNMAKDVQGGTTLQDLVLRYPDLDPNEIYSVYNAYHSRPGDVWGPAKQNSDQLQQLGIKPSKPALPASATTIKKVTAPSPGSNIPLLGKLIPPQTKWQYTNPLTGAPEFAGTYEEAQANLEFLLNQYSQGGAGTSSTPSYFVPTP